MRLNNNSNEFHLFQAYMSRASVNNLLFAVTKSAKQANLYIYLHGNGKILDSLKSGLHETSGGFAHIAL